MNLLAMFLAINITSGIINASVLKKCRYLESLHQKYSSVTLTPKQESLKARLVAWYMQNCK